MHPHLFAYFTGDTIVKLNLASLEIRWHNRKTVAPHSVQIQARRKQIHVTASARKQFSAERNGGWELTQVV